MKIGVIGNSHLASFKLGWELIKENYPEIELIFFGSPTTSLRALEVKDGKLVPKTQLVKDNLIWTSGGLEVIPGDMDAYFCVGMGFSYIHLIALLKNHRVPRDFDGINSEIYLISDTFYESAMRGTLKNSVAIKVVSQIREISNAKIIYSPNPYGDISLLQSAEYNYFRFKETRELAFEFYKYNLEFMMKDFEAIPVEQPKETIIDKMFTSKIYSRGSVKLKKGMLTAHDENDYFHMNADFGARSLEGLMRQL